MNVEDYTKILDKAIEKMDKLSEKRFWAIWAILAMFAFGYILSSVAAMLK
ncbi:hypothetical protein [Neisseria shayeganii]|uniref:Uncharacterized protein n=1 Tax=Neisseria shayeganii TaxID=607712 RepID=A0A7D7NCP4_9NEIS|nr:hypothetical protein [Neisseria shayeganii]QMT41236.1 hypothetical protein H3L94_04200 [Neisseria shayeganii]